MESTRRRRHQQEQGKDPGQSLYATDPGQNQYATPPSSVQGRSVMVARGGGTTTFRAGSRTVLEQVPGQQRPQLVQALAACDKIYSGAMPQSGAVKSAAGLNDVANSAAFFVAMAHYVYWNGQPGAPAEAQGPHIQYLSANLRRTLVAKGGFVRKSDLEKQRVHDSLVLSACIPMIQYAKAKKSGNESAKQRLRVRAAQLLGQVGLTPTALRFNPDGTVQVSGSTRASQHRNAGGG